MNRVAALLGVAFGFGLGAARLNDYDAIHDMLLLREPEVFLLMASAMAVALPVLWLLERGAWHTPGGGLMRLSRSNIERKHIFGSAVFGGGWAITGASFASRSRSCARSRRGGAVRRSGRRTVGISEVNARRCEIDGKTNDWVITRMVALRGRKACR